MIRVRFAPSPTGYLHIGGLRAALFNWLYARHYGGVFLLRIEDTDLERSRPEYTTSILDSLAWCSLTPDEPTLIQSTRITAHKAIAEQLLTEGKAYTCYCSPEELEQRLGRSETEESFTKYDKRCKERTPRTGTEPYVIRFKVPDTCTHVEFHDLIRGPIRVQADQLDDFIIVRSDGTPTYNFVVVVDDAYMGITHVIRGEDHISNTPKQILLYQACGYALPAFAHLPLILGPDGNKLSKRDAVTAVPEYRAQGFLADALCNYLVRLGWSHGDQEIFTREELIGYFSLDQVGKKGAIFDSKKLEWVNSIYIRQESPEQLLTFIIRDCAPDFITRLNKWEKAQIIFAITLYQERVKTLRELIDEVYRVYQGSHEYTSHLKNTIVTAQAQQLLVELCHALTTITVWDIESISRTIKEVCSTHGVKLPVVAQPLRVALTGVTASPGVFELLYLIGQSEACMRIKRILTP